MKTETFTLPSGTKIGVNFPGDLSVGDRFTGTLRTELAGKDEKERAKSLAELNRYTLSIGGQPTPATETMFTRTIPSTLNADEPYVILMVSGKQVGNATVPMAQTPPPTPQNASLPTCGQMGRNVVVTDHCDGIIASPDSCSIGGVPLQPLAESPRMRVLLNTNQTPGPTQISYTEQGKETNGAFQNLAVSITSPNTNLLRNQKTTMEVVAQVKGIQQDVSLDVVNDTPGIVSISGGDNHHFTIHPTDVQADGTYHQNFTVTANQAGAWGATATVSCIGGASGPIAGGPQAAATPTGVSAPGPVIIPLVPTPTPTPSPILLGATPSPTPSPSPSPSPCASPPPPTTYTVMNLGPLSESDYPNSCRANGVNNAGNVIGVCSPSYFGVTVGGTWHAFRTEPGKVIDKEKDDLGLPAGITSGYAFATGINADGHVVGYWSSGGEKAFWHDGSRKGESGKYSKMINLHPDTSIFTTSRAFALNSSDDVVGAAYGPALGPIGFGVTFAGHAVIWPGADPKKIKDLNDDLDPKYKKDWILIVAFGISDDGDIVGRALNTKPGSKKSFMPSF